MNGKLETHSSGYGIAKELGMNLFVAEDASAALMRFSCDSAREVALMPKAQMIVWIL